ncbi:hypothetical protein K491DRAFT_321617 [Lophiostoma macrostomum CBS 122681]|uniref:Extracellular membrane protein CFEM domain-containing protein n=1 Tax=Lophiostoma macrostomum CBS 122681 TaxID=1314788 RepID=A0A6A6TFB7_9PLEO|nr:hypothetical protein K491DRAFT_321617 [Lophiostoma macrostomum CBS 122681]
MLPFIIYTLIPLLGVHAVPQTSIFIDQIPGYSSLASCGQDQLSTIVRAQYSGCGDNMQLTSFSCFCLDSSAHFASVISTAVQEQCSVAPATVTLTSQAAVVTQALDVFQSYCARSIELALVSNSASSPTRSASMSITAPPTTTPSSQPSSPPSSSSPSTHILAIVLPVVLTPLLIALLILIFYRRRSRTQHLHELDSSAPVTVSGSDSVSGLRGYGYNYSGEKAPTPVLKDGDSAKEMLGDYVARQEMGGGERVYAHELGSGNRTSGRVELDGGFAGKAV